jgi:hypothetical protein
MFRLLLILLMYVGGVVVDDDDDDGGDGFHLFPKALYGLYAEEMQPWSLGHSPVASQSLWESMMAP